MELKTELLKKITQFRIPPLLKKRTIQLSIALVACFILIAHYAGNLRQARHTIDEQQLQIKLLTEESDYLDKEIIFLKAQNAALSAPAQETADSAQQSVNPVESLYNPETTTSSNQAQMDSIKKRYEEIFVTYFFLKKCNQVNPVDFHIITSALSQEMASVNAPGRLQHDIVTAAQGSYKEMYSQTACDNQTIAALSGQYKAYIASLSSNFNLK